MSSAVKEERRKCTVDFHFTMLANLIIINTLGNFFFFVKEKNHQKRNNGCDVLQKNILFAVQLFHHTVFEIFSLAKSTAHERLRFFFQKVTNLAVRVKENSRGRFFHVCSKMSPIYRALIKSNRLFWKNRPCAIIFLAEEIEKIDLCRLDSARWNASRNWIFQE